MVVRCFKYLGELFTFFVWKHWHYKTVYTEKRHFKNTDRTLSYFIFNVFKGFEDLDFFYREV